MKADERTPGVVPVYRTEAEAIVGEKLALATAHFLRRWVPRLGQTAALVVLELRGEVLAGGLDEPWCEISQPELAARLGCTPKTIRRALGQLERYDFVRVEARRRYSPAHGRAVVATNRYWVAMYDPPVPGQDGEGRVLARQAERLLREGRLLPGDEPASLSHPPLSIGSQDRQKGADPAASSAPLHGTPGPAWAGMQGPKDAASAASRASPAVSGREDRSECGDAGTGRSVSTAVVADDFLDISSEVVVAALVSAGVEAGRARELITRFGAERVRRQVAWLPVRLGERPETDRVTNPVGYLIRAIEHDYPPPRGATAPAIVTTSAVPATSVSRANAGAGAAVSAEEVVRAARLREAYEALPVERRETIWGQARSRVAEELGGLEFVPATLVWGAVYEILVGEREERAAAPAPAREVERTREVESGAGPGAGVASDEVWARLGALPSSPEALGGRLVKWAASEGLVARRGSRQRDDARARQVLWTMLHRMGLGQRRIASLAGVDRARVREALDRAAGDPEVAVLAERWAARFLGLLEVIGP